MSKLYFTFFFLTHTNTRTFTKFQSFQFRMDFLMQGSSAAGWPSSLNVSCLHCTEICTGQPLPAVKYHDSYNDVFHVYGYFCRPGCALGHVNDSKGDTCRQIIWTQTVFRRFFGLRGSPKPFGPRSSLKKFGGPLSLAEFYGEDDQQTLFIASIQPPFITSSIVTQVERTRILGQTDGGIGHGIRRPEFRTEPIARPTETGQEPAILEYLATLHLDDDDEPPSPPRKKAASTSASSAQATTTEGASVSSASGAIAATKSKPKRKTRVGVATSLDIFD
jgi:hypothetical protein